MTEHKYIWLQPECCADPDEGRHWCQDPEPVECDGGKPWTKYILASEHEALERQLAEVSRLLKMCKSESVSRLEKIIELSNRCHAYSETIVKMNDEFSTLRSDLARVTDEHGEALGLLSVAKCPNCDGSGVTIGITNHTIPRCCGRFLPSGECCGYPEPECAQEQYQEPCEWCARKGGLLTPPEQKHEHDYGVDEVGDIVRCQICGVPRALIDTPPPQAEGVGDE